MKHPFSRTWRSLAIGTALSLLAGCATFEESGLPGSASSMARNQIMSVRAEPETFGHYRLSSLMRLYPDLEVFVAKRGTPDFIAETRNRAQQYFILYYLDDRQAYAARTRAPRPSRLEFSGPYPITDRERKTLRQLRELVPAREALPPGSAPLALSS